MDTKFSVSDFIAYCNQTLEYAYTGCTVEGEVSEMKTSQGKWVFFSLKDEGGSIDCFIPIWQLRTPIEDGMKVIVRGTPKLTNWGKFSFTIQAIMPVGQGNIKKSFELLKKKLEKMFQKSASFLQLKLPAMLTLLKSLTSVGVDLNFKFVILKFRDLSRQTKLFAL